MNEKKLLQGQLGKEIQHKQEHSPFLPLFLSLSLTSFPSLLACVYVCAWVCIVCGCQTLAERFAHIMRSAKRI